MNIRKTISSIVLVGGIVLSSLGQAFAYTQDDINSMVNEAETKIGLPYTWGANPNSEVEFDCSSLVAHLYKHLGINLPRCSYEQATVGMEVSLQDVRAGDIICMHTSNRNGEGGVTHVGIAINNTQMIHAKGRAYGVVKQNIADYQGRIVTIRRILVNESEVAK